jgi:hypothetical protein
MSVQCGIRTETLNVYNFDYFHQFISIFSQCCLHHNCDHAVSLPSLHLEYISTLSAVMIVNFILLCYILLFVICIVVLSLVWPVWESWYRYVNTLSFQIFSGSVWVNEKMKLVVFRPIFFFLIHISVSFSPEHFPSLKQNTCYRLYSSDWRRTCTEFL